MYSLGDAYEPHPSANQEIDGIPAVPSSLPSSDLPSVLRRHLSFHPLNELPFFLESIGLPPSTESELMFLNDHPSLIPAVAALAHFGFPWFRLGLLFPNILLQVPPDLISARLVALEESLRPLLRAAIIAACLAFLESHEPDLLAVAEAIGEKPETLIAARAELES